MTQVMLVSSCFSLLQTYHNKTHIAKKHKQTKNPKIFLRKLRIVGYLVNPEINYGTCKLACPDYKKRIVNTNFYTWKLNIVPELILSNFIFCLIIRKYYIMIFPRKFKSRGCLPVHYGWWEGKRRVGKKLKIKNKKSSVCAARDKVANFVFKKYKIVIFILKPTGDFS